MGSSGDDILDALEGTAAVRRRPGMHVGLIYSPAVHRVLLEQTLFTVLDEAANGPCQRIQVALHADRSVTVEDDGPGLSFLLTCKGVRLAESLVAGFPPAYRLERSRSDTTKRLFHAGLVVVNALSEWFQLEVRREGQLWRQRFQHGKPQGPLVPVEASGRTGTRITYKVDQVLIPAPLRVKKLRACIHRLAAEVPNVSLSFHEERTPTAP